MQQNLLPFLQSMVIHLFMVITLGMLGNFHAFLSSDFFSKLTFSKTAFRNTIRVSNGLDPNQNQHFVNPDLGPNCLQRLSANKASKELKF